jgi:hypothetical protein
MPRNFRSNIVIDGSSYFDGFEDEQWGNTMKLQGEQYEQDVFNVLQYIYQRPPMVGTLLIDEIVRACPRKTVTIIPELHTVKGFNDAPGAFPVNPAASVPRGVRPYRGKDDPETRRDDRFDLLPFTGTGGGSDVFLVFTPNPDLPSGSKGNISDAADDMLLHELVHALRMMLARDNAVPTKDASLSNFEEWLAIMLTNIYMSEKRDWPLRARHKDTVPLPMGEDNPRRFLEHIENRYLMGLMFSQHLRLFGDIAHQALAQPRDDTLDDGLDTPWVNMHRWVGHFNPIRVYADRWLWNRRYFLNDKVRYEFPGAFDLLK